MFRCEQPGAWRLSGAIDSLLIVELFAGFTKVH